MRRSLLSILVACAVVSPFPVLQAQNTNAPGPIGWRGNWTGSFPQSKAPAEWQRVSKLMSTVRTQVSKPAGDQPSGESASCGIVPQWLVLGPFAPKDANPKSAIEEAFIDEAGVQPSDGDKVGDKTWKKVESLGSDLDMDAVFPEPAPKEGSTAYAHAWIYAGQPGSVILRFTTLPAIDAKAWVNGKLVFQATKWRYWWEHQFGHKVELNKGWNRLLVKVVRGMTNRNAYYLSPWRFSFFFYAAAPYEYDAPKNIVWATKIVGDGCVAGPIVVGDKVFTMSDPFDLVCLDKKTGKTLWIRSNSYYDTLSDAEKASDAFKDIAPMAKRLGEINDALVAAGTPAKELADEKVGLQDKINGAMAKADPKKYSPAGIYAHPGSCAPTPVSDGRSICVWLGTGVAAAYDLDGNRKWTRYERSGPIGEHGNNCSPALAGGRLIIFDTMPQTTIAFDPATGKEVWRRTGESLRKEYPRIFADHDLVRVINGSGAPVRFAVEGTEVVMLQNIIFRASDGKVLWVCGEGQWFLNLITTSVIDDGKIYTLDDGCAGTGLTVSRLPTAFEPDGTLKVERLGSLRVLGAGVQTSGECLCASPVVHEGLVYFVDMMGRVQVVDARDPSKMSVLYKKNFGFPENRAIVYQMGSCYSNPVLIGRNVCFMSLTGTFVMLEAGPKPRVVAVNRMENELPKTRFYLYLQHPEMFAGSPVVDGDRVYIRGDENLCCIGKQ